MNDLTFIVILVIISGIGGYICFFLYKELKRSNSINEDLKEDLKKVLEIVMKGEKVLEQLEQEEKQSKDDKI